MVGTEVAAHIAEEGTVGFVALGGGEIEGGLAGGQQQCHQTVGQGGFAGTVAAGDEAALGMDVGGVQIVEGSPVVYGEFG